VSGLKSYLRRRLFMGDPMVPLWLLVALVAALLVLVAL
jgi:hypothetical protein